MATPEPYPYRQLNYPVNNLEQNFDQTKKIQVRANIGIPTSVNQTNKVLGVTAATGELGWIPQSGGSSIRLVDRAATVTIDSNGALLYTFDSPIQLNTDQSLAYWASFAKMFTMVPDNLICYHESPGSGVTLFAEIDACLVDSANNTDIIIRGSSQSTLITPVAGASHSGSVPAPITSFIEIPSSNFTNQDILTGFKLVMHYHPNLTFQLLSGTVSKLYAQL